MGKAKGGEMTSEKKNECRIYVIENAISGFCCNRMECCHRDAACPGTARHFPPCVSPDAKYDALSTLLISISKAKLEVAAELRKAAK